jgi:uncharacterized protein YceH (UPF0502 family)
MTKLPMVRSSLKPSSMDSSFVIRHSFVIGCFVIRPFGNSLMSDSSAEQLPPVKVLSKTQRRVLGVLIEKGITTPEYYPLTPKALATGCNQKNNRSPLSEYSEDDVTRAIDQLRELGLAAVVHTESGRTERFRHYARKRFPFSEAQLAIMAELWLRGRQSIGDLRTRASRMHDIPTLEQLREELKSLAAQGFVQANGSLESRGVEVDHNFYKPDEGKTLTAGDFAAQGDDDGTGSGVLHKNSEVPFDRATRPSPTAEPRVVALEQTVADLAARLHAAEQSLSQLSDRFESLHRELGANV